MPDRTDFGILVAKGLSVIVGKIMERTYEVYYLRSISNRESVSRHSCWKLRDSLHLGPECARVFGDLSAEDKERYKADIRATNILLQGIPKDIYTLINHFTDAKDIWDNVKMILEGSELTKDDRESQLYDEFEHFCQIKGETIHVYYVRFTKLINDMRNIKMTMPRMQLNSKFVNNMLPEWSRFITEVKLNRGLKESNFDQLYAYLKQHEDKATDQDDRVVVQDVRGRYKCEYSRKTISEELCKRSCWNWECGRIGAHCTVNVQPTKRPQDSDYFKDKMLLMHAYENEVVLDEEQLLFLAGEQVTNFDDDVDDLALNVDHVFEADQCDAFDSDVEMMCGPLKQTIPVVHDSGRSTHDTIKNLKHQIQEKDNMIKDLKVIVSTMNDRSCEPYNANDVTDLIEQNERFRAEIEKVVQIILWYLDSGYSKHMMGNRSKLKNFVEKFIGTVKFGNDHVGAIMGYGDYMIGDSVISQEKHSCFVRNMDGVDLLKGCHITNLYTISVDEMLRSSPICLLSKASKSKSWLWHRRLNHLNFGTINDLARKDLVRGLPRLKYKKDHLCSACQLGKSKKFSHKPKLENTNMEVLHTFHMDLCGPMRVTRVLMGRNILFILVIVDDYSRFTWVKFLSSKDETPEFVINFLKQIQIFIKSLLPRISQQYGVVRKTGNRTLVEQPLTNNADILKAPIFLVAEVKPDLIFLPTCLVLYAKLQYIESEDLVKLDEYGDVLKNKARLVAKGYRQEEGIDFEESFAPVDIG
ncbi:retrovirus-related pol polyprotein from transposon TNT 1-94 [Tanacetum coccineum]